MVKSSETAAPRQKGKYARKINKTETKDQAIKGIPGEYGIKRAIKVNLKFS